MRNVADTRAKANEMGDPDGRIPDGFELGIANNGQYVKKFKGTRHQFGAVSAGWKAAMNRFTHDWAYIIQGKVPPVMTGPGGPAPTSLLYIASAFMQREKRRWERGQVKSGAVTDTRNVIEIAVTSVGPNRDARHLTPDDFADLRHALSHVWKRTGEGDKVKWTITTTRIKPGTLRRRIVAVRAMFNWAGPAPRGTGLLPAGPSYGDSFGIVSDSAIAKDQKATERERGPKRWEVDQIRPLLNALDALDEQMPAAFLLTINCGFTSADLTALPASAVDLVGGWIDFARVKTGVVRPRLKLWPETVSALREVKALELKPAPGWAEYVVHQEKSEQGDAIGKPVKLSDCMFIHRDGKPWTISQTYTDANGLPTSTHRNDRFAVEFNKALASTGFKKNGNGFAYGRHTFESHALRVADKSLVDAVMGHSTGEMSQRYDHALDDDRTALARQVRARLLPDAEHWDKATGTPSTGGDSSLRIAG